MIIISKLESSHIHAIINNFIITGRNGLTELNHGTVDEKLKIYQEVYHLVTKT